MLPALDNVATVAGAPTLNCVKLPEAVPTRVAKAGTFLQFGVTDQVLQFGVTDQAAKVTIDPYRIYDEEIPITGPMAVNQSFERAAELFLDGVVDPGEFISDRLPLDAYAEAIDRLRRGVGRKIQVLPGERG